MYLSPFYVWRTVDCLSVAGIPTSLSAPLVTARGRWKIEACSTVAKLAGVPSTTLDRMRSTTRLLCRTQPFSSATSASPLELPLPTTAQQRMYLTHELPLSLHNPAVPRSPLRLFSPASPPSPLLSSPLLIDLPQRNGLHLNTSPQLRFYRIHVDFYYCRRTPYVLVR